MAGFPQAQAVPAHRDNQGGTRSPLDITHIVIHTGEGTEEAISSWFGNPASKVSAHYTVTRDGRVLQHVDDLTVAWHVGPSYNRQTIGIEHEGLAADPNTWTPELIEASTSLFAWLSKEYALAPPPQVLLEHSEIDPLTRLDPGPYFPRGPYLALAGAKMAGVPPKTGAPSTAGLWLAVLAGVAVLFGMTR